MPDVVFILSEHMLATSTTWPSDMLAAANHVAKGLCPTKPLFNLTISAETLSAVTCHSGITLTPQQSFEDIDKADILYLPSL